MSMQDLAFPLTIAEKVAAMNTTRSTGVGRAKSILAIDPGTCESGWCVYDGSKVSVAGVMPNTEMLAYLRAVHFTAHDYTLAIEMVASYGMPVGREVFETVRWIGRFQQVWAEPDAALLIYRRDVKLHLCNSTKAKDANIRQVILDKFASTGGGKTPQVGTKKQPGPLYGVSTHAWAALAVAIYVSETRV